MAPQATVLAAGDGWSVHDVVCGAGPADRPFEERHETVAIAVVTAGTFQYRTARGRAVLAPGALLLGNSEDWFVCSHQHATGDRCVAFHFDPARFEAVVAAIPGARTAAFEVPRLPPLPQLAPLLAEVEVARDGGDAGALEELGVRVAAEVAGVLAGTTGTTPAASRRDERRVTEALRRIEAQADERLSLAELARASGMSPYHFLRVFHQVAGVTPYRYVLHTRLLRAAVRLRSSSAAISTIALAAGFNDLSTFNRRFRHIMGASPGEYRAGRSPGHRRTRRSSG